MQTAETVRHEDATFKWFLLQSVAMVALGTIIGTVVASKFIFPDFWGTVSWLTFGRLRGFHVNLVVFGWLLPASMACIAYIIPRLCGVPLYCEKTGVLSAAIWIVIDFLMILTLPLGMTQGKEYLELIWPIDALVVIAWLLFSYTIFQTIAHRKFEQLYVSVWYTMGCLFWTAAVYLIGNVHVFSGVDDANVNWFYGHNLVGLIATPIATAIAYYVMPKSANSPLYSHKLSIIGFWVLAFVYPWNGAHHLIYGPLPEWLQTTSIVFSFLLLIPVSAVVTNMFLTPRGLYQLYDNVPLQFVFMGTVWYTITCLQGPLQALRSVHQVTHFTDWVVGHAHGALFGFASFMAIAGIYWALPRVLRCPMWNKSLTHWHFWLSVVGFFIMNVALAWGGFMQGYYWKLAEDPNSTKSFVDSLEIIRPFWKIRITAGTLMMIGQILFALNVAMTFVFQRELRGEIVEPETDADASAAAA